MSSGIPKPRDLFYLLKTQWMGGYTPPNSQQSIGNAQCELRDHKPSPGATMLKYPQPHR